jgi:hypothetical protein
MKRKWRGRERDEAERDNDENEKCVITKNYFLSMPIFFKSGKSFARNASAASAASERSKNRIFRNGRSKFLESAACPGKSSAQNASEASAASERSKKYKF